MTRSQKLSRAEILAAIADAYSFAPVADDEITVDLLVDETGWKRDKATVIIRQAQADGLLDEPAYRQGPSGRRALAWKWKSK